jgi:hypothetical protein
VKRDGATRTPQERTFPALPAARLAACCCCCCCCLRVWSVGVADGVTIAAAAACCCCCSFCCPLELLRLVVLCVAGGEVGIFLLIHQLCLIILLVLVHLLVQVVRRVQG